MKFYGVELTSNDVDNMVIHSLSEAPSNPVAGQVYYNTTDKSYYGHNGTEWIEISNNNNITFTNITKEPTGFLEPENVTVSYDSTTRKVTLTGTTTLYYRGEIVSEVVSGWESPAHDASPTTPLFLKYNDSGFVWSTTSWTFDEIQIAFIYYTSGSTFLFGLREPHGLMQWQSHQNLHSTIGTYKSSGGSITGITEQSTTAADRRPSVSACTMWDEDLKTVVAELTNGQYTLFSLTSTSTPSISIDQSDIVPLTNGDPYINFWSGSSWGQTVLTNNNYMSVWLMAFPTTADAQSQKYRFMFIQGQSQGTLDSQLSLTPYDVNLGSFKNGVAEFVFVAQFIIKGTGNGWTIEDVIPIAGTKALQIGNFGAFLTAVTSDQVSYDNTTSGLTATDVKSAIDELEARIDALENP